MSKFQWINVFIRDILLAIVMIWVNYSVNFQSWFAAFAMGMIVVLTTWHLSDLIKLNKTLDDGFHGFTRNNLSSLGTIHNSI